MIKSRTLTQIFLVFSLVSQAVSYFISLRSDFPFALWLTLRPNVGYPIWEFLTVEPGPLDDFNSYRFANESLQLFPTVGGFVLYPFSFLLYQIFGFMSEAVGAVIFFAIVAALLIRGLSRLGMSSVQTFAIFSSYPILFSLSRGNNEILLFAVALYLLSTSLDEFSQNRSIGWAVLLTMIEPVPSTLFWVGDKFRARFTFVRKVIIISVFALVLTGFIIPPGDVIAYLEALRSFGGGHATTTYPGSSLFSTSLQSGIRVAHYLLGLSPPRYDDAVTMFVNQLLFYIGCLLVLYFGFSSRYQLIDRIILTSACWLAFYATSFDYRLVWLLAPLVLIFRESGNLVKPLRVMQVSLIGLICTPKVFIWWPETGGHHIGSLLNPLLLTTLILITARCGRTNSGIAELVESVKV